MVWVSQTTCLDDLKGVLQPGRFRVRPWLDWDHSASVRSVLLLSFSLSSAAFTQLKPLSDAFPSLEHQNSIH